jgi:outer membrane receptor protein involved in Fe transport
MIASFKSMLIALVIVLACGRGASAQSNASITGRVIDQNGSVIVNATVAALNIASGRVVTAKTDSSGGYRITRLQPGSYRVSATVEGFAAAARSLALRDNESVTQDLSLAPGIIQDTLTITAGKGAARPGVDTPQSITVTDSIEIEKRRPASTLDALEKTPNLTQVGSNPAGARPRLRGLTSNRLLLVIDGERLNNVRSDPLSGVSPSIVDVTQLDSAEVISSAGSSLYGSDALAGTVNLITKAPSRTDGGTYLGVRFDGDAHSNGWFRRSAAAISFSTPRFALRASGSLFRTADYHAGGESIPLEAVLRFGKFATDMGNATGNNVARTYAVWDLNSGAEIPNGQAHGFNDQIDVFFFPSSKHSFRYRQLNSQHKDIGFPFITPPFDGRNQFNGFRRLDKQGIKYEAHEITRWLPHAAIGLYRQKYSFADDNFVSTINAGSSWTIEPIPETPDVTLSVLTGNRSTFTLGNFTDGKNSVTSYGLDVQATFIPHTNTVVTTGIGYLRDSSIDEFSRVDFNPDTLSPRKIITGRAGNPDSVYENLGWFNLIEYEPLRWLRLTGSLRVDRWKTEARVTRGFPLGTESAVLEASLSQLVASPGQINIEGLTGITGLVNGTNGITTDNTIVTGNLGAVLRLPGRINPYLRWGTSYREPGITERYTLRDFGDPTFSVLLVSNTALKPERGKSYDAGIKIQRDRWNASFGYFRNNFEDFLRSSFADALFVPADPSRGLDPISPFFPFHGVLYVQRTNTARARIQGVEAAYEISVPLGKLGSVLPFGTLGWLKGSDLTADSNALALIEQFYNRQDTPVRLKGSAEDAPLSGITPFRTVFGARYDSPEGRWFGEYQVRYQSRVERADPIDLSSTIITQYGTFASLNSLAKHSIRSGYTYRKETYRMLFTFGVDNLADRLYFEHFQNAPAPGRSFIFGVTMDFSNLLKR